MRARTWKHGGVGRSRRARRGGVNAAPGGGLSPQTRLIEKQIVANKACN